MISTTVDPEIANLPPATQGYLLGAALVSRFRPEQLTPVDTSSLTVLRPSDELRNAGLAYVIGNSHPVDFDDPARFCWSLDDDLRRRVLDSVGGLDMIQKALASLPAPADDEPLKVFFGAGTTKQAPSLAELSAQRQALVWLQSYLDSDVRLFEIDRQIDRAGLTAPLERLTGNAFVGRTDELDLLRRFVGVLPDPAPDAGSTLIGKIAATLGAAIGSVSDWVTTIGTDADVVLVTAPGGMGKSALLARFVLQHWQAEPQWRTPFAFLDFDRPSLMSRDPRVLLEEIGRQVAIQIGAEVPLPWARGSASEASDEAAARSNEAIEASDVDRAYFRSQQVADYSHGLHDALQASPLAGKPLLLVFDTLERVFRRGRHWIAALDDLIGILRYAAIDLRVVAGGRAFLSDQRANQSLASRDLGWRERALTELSTDAAEALLVRRNLNPEQARAIVKQIGGVPLSLHLVADYFQKKGGDPAHLKGLTRSWLFKRRLQESVIQGNLYQRILTHIEDKQVQRLAHPGLILREVTPALIKDVLAVPCGLGEVSDQRAEHLFDELAKEFTLVDDLGSKRLKHRSDVRQVMLSQMLAKEKDRARQISEAAVRYYFKFTDPKNRAEELYHRLLLSQDKDVIEERWLPGVKDYLGEEVIDEIPSIPLRVYAAGKLDLEVPDQDWVREADNETWERKITQDFDARLKLGQVREALQLVAGRAEFTAGSRLYPLVAQAYADVRQYSMAQRWVDAGLQRLDNINDAAGRATLLPLYLVRARIFEHIVDDAGTQAAALDDEIEQLDALWREFKPDTRVLLIALLELEVFQQRNAPDVRALQVWLESHVSNVQAEGGTIDPPLAIRVLPALVLGTDGSPCVDAARWLIEVPGVREAVAPLIQRFATRPLEFNGIKADVLAARVALATDGKATKPLSVDEVKAVAHAIRLSARETRDELRNVKR